MSALVTGPPPPLGRKTNPLVRKRIPLIKKMVQLKRAAVLAKKTGQPPPKQLPAFQKKMTKFFRRMSGPNSIA